MTGRPKTEPDSRTAMYIRIDPDLHQQLVAAARERDLSMNYMVVAAIREFLPRLLPVAEVTLTRGATP